MAKSKIKFLLTVTITIISLILLAVSAFAAQIGDVDVNGEIKSADARLALRAAVRLENLTKEQFTAADIDCSGDIRASDARSILRAAVGLEKLTRVHKFSEWETLNEASCSKSGIKTRVCACGETQRATIPATGNHTFGEWSVKAQPTCVKTGTKERKCVCGKAQTEKIPATGNHSFGEWSVKTQPTCVKTGTKERKCVCGKAQTEKIPATGNHSFGEWSVKTQPTCVKTGTKERKCVCGKAQTEKIPATGNHSFGEWSVKTQPTCVKTGTKERKCVCGKTQTETLPATGKHTIRQTGIVDATCTGKDGYYKWQCTVCKKTGTTVIPAGHTYEIEQATVSKSKTCTRCGFVAEKSFNEYVNPIKQKSHRVSYLDIKENSSKTTEEKLVFSQSLSMLLIMQGSSVAQLKKELLGEMNYKETVFSTFYRQKTLNSDNFPITSRNTVSELKDTDVLSYTVEKVDKLDLTENLPDSYTSKNGIIYDMSAYNEREIDNLIKLTVVVKPEKYSEIKNSDKPSALMNATGKDLKTLVSQAENIDNNDEMGKYASVNCKEATSAVTIIYYFDSSDDAPVAAVYKTEFVFDTRISMNMMEMLTGYIDFTTASKTYDFYFFDDYFTE